LGPPKPEQSGQTEALSKPLDLTGRHWLLLQIHQVDERAMLFEEPLGGAGGLRILHAEDLDTQHNSSILAEKVHPKPA
jgi:hypothetical protein